MKFLRNFQLKYLLLSLAFAACNSGSGSNEQDSAVTPKKKKKSTVKVSESGAHSESEESSGPEAKTAIPEKDSGTIKPPVEEETPTAKGLLDPRAFFTETVEPQFQIGCAHCHAEPRFKPNPAGPLSIFDYKLMREFLSVGAGKLDNKLMDKARAQIAHGGGSACGTDVTQPPCSLIAQWWELEFASNSSSDSVSSGIAGEIEMVKFDGAVYGYAASLLDPAATLNVDFYIDGDKEIGTKLAPQIASRSGYSGGVQGPHRFQFSLVDTYRDAVEHQIYAYATVAGKQLALKGSPFRFKAWKPKGDAAFYKGKFVGCGCHSRNYIGDYDQLGTPSPYQGGSPTNNKLYIMGAGGGHAGGGYDTAFVKAFWTAEFGP